MTWRFAQASVPGTSHLKTNTPCQDASNAYVCRSEAGECLVALVADGAGSASRSQDGSKAAVATVLRCVSDWWASCPIEAVTEQQIKDWVFEAIVSITELAEADTLHPKTFACTLLGAVLTPSCSAYFQIGDGGIVCRQTSQFLPVFWPEESEAANLTYFLTDEDWEQHLQVMVLPETPNQVAVFTDGLQLLLLNFSDKTAHQPFFNKVFSQLSQYDPDQLKQVNQAVAAYLSSEGINSRTDDDKSLVIAMLEGCVK